jgi:Uma2 family endonuclease
MAAGAQTMSMMPKRRLLSDAEYLLIERQATQKSEFLRGEMFAMAGATEDHETVAGNCFGLLWQELRKRGCKVFKGDMKVQVSAARRFTYPDVMVVCGERQFADERRDVLLNPLLLIEVLSESTADYDRGGKADDYRLLDSLRELLIVAQDEPRIEHFVWQDKRSWSVTTVQGLDATIELPSVNHKLHLSDIFAGVDFSATSRPALRVAEDVE